MQDLRNEDNTIVQQDQSYSDCFATITHTYTVFNKNSADKAHDGNVSSDVTMSKTHDDDSKSHASVQDPGSLPVLQCETPVFNVSKWNPKFKSKIDSLLEEFPKIGNDVRYDPSIIRGLGVEYDVQWLDKPIPYRAGSFRLSPTDQQNMAKILNKYKLMNWIRESNSPSGN